jgi:nitroimidazol reductase NimA-like FMN-containing flavoprotein (pyridoxamine 5'-phosphate oxidase superfamily)
MDERDVQLAKEMLESTIYAAVATSSRDGQPWNSPVFVVYDDKLTFYWASASKSSHSQHIAENPRAFLVVFNSTVPWGGGEGVYIEANAAEVTDIEEITHACQLRYQRAAKANQPPSDFTGALPRRIYRAIPEHIWINADATQKGYFVDTRKEIDIESLRQLIAGAQPS